MTEYTFEQLNLIDPLMRAIRAEGYQRPTPIQARAIPSLLQGRDQLSCAQTGTGKTAAFALPILQRLVASKRPAGGGRSPRVLVLAPTRELAAQIGQSFTRYGKHTRFQVAVVFGGVVQGAQTRALRRGVDILVATPGRLLDLLQQGHARLDRIEVLVLDEADRMLDMGFVPDVRRILKAVPKKRQTLLFSATMPPDVASLASSILVDPVRLEIRPTERTADNIDQRMHFVTRANKQRLLAHLLAEDPSMQRALVFSRTKHGADRIVKQLNRVGVHGEVIHGNKSQRARERALESFRSGRARLLVATDIAARGIDVDGITHVVNFDLPNVPETYVHRIGRTARAGSSGVAVSFCDQNERGHLKDIERLIGSSIHQVADHPYAVPQPPTATMALAAGADRGTAGQPKAPTPRGRRRYGRGRNRTTSVARA